MMNRDIKFNFRQRAALAIAANMAVLQYEHAEITQHFVNLTQNLSYTKSLACSIFNDNKGLLYYLRNYFSHAEHDEILALDANVKAFYENLYENVKQQLLGQNASSVAEARYKNERKETVLEYIAGDKLTTFPFDGNVTDMPQYVIAFMLAPFISRSQANELTSRIYFGKDARIPDGEKKKDAPKTAAIKEIISKAAQPDSVTIRTNAAESPQWLEPRGEWAFSVLNHLKARYPLNGDEALPDRYYFAQLISFVIFHEILPCEFERIKTVHSTEDNERESSTILEQKKVFSGDPNLPLCIKYNTIAAKWSDGLKFTLSLKALETIVAAYLRDKDKDKIKTFVHDWIFSNKDYAHRKPASKPDQAIDDIIKKRCAFLQTRYSRQKSDKGKEYDQITFICQRIAVAWQKVHDKSLSKQEYENLRQKVRFFNKEELKRFLGDKVWEKSAIELGRGDDKQLRKAITKDDRGDVYNDMTKAYCDFLAGVSEGIHKKTDEEKTDLAKRLKCRLPKQSAVNPDFPVGIPPNELYGLIDKEGKDGKKTVTNIKTIGQELRKELPFDYDKPKVDQNKTLQNKTLQIWFRKQLTLAMAWSEFKKLMTYNGNHELRTVSGQSFEKICDHDVELQTGNHSVVVKIGKLHRRHTRVSKEILEALIKEYADGVKKVPMFRDDEKSGKISIETAMKNCDSERLILIEAALCFEQKWRRNNPDKIENVTEKDGGYIPFRNLCSGSNVREYRNAAIHGGVMKFSACPAPLSEYIKEIEKRK